MFRKTLDFAEAGDNVGVLLRGVQRHSSISEQHLPQSEHFRGTIIVHACQAATSFCASSQSGRSFFEPMLRNEKNDLHF